MVFQGMGQLDVLFHTYAMTGWFKTGTPTTASSVLDDGHVAECSTVFDTVSDEQQVIYMRSNTENVCMSPAHG